jgi:hypothetical protein
MQMEKVEKQIGSRDRRFVVWSRADALVMKTGQPFEEVLPTAMAGYKLSSTDLRGVLDLQKVNQEVRTALLGVAFAPSPVVAVTAGVQPAKIDSIDTVLDDVITPNVEDDVSADDVDPETRLIAARDRVVAFLNWNRELPYHVIPFPKLGVSFFMVGKITIDGDHREWNHNGKHAKFKALIPDCESKIIVLNGETFPKSFFFEDWTWKIHEREKKGLCSGNLKIFCFKHEINAEYICWINPGGKGDPWRFIYKMTATGLEMTRFRLKPDSKEDYVRLDAKPVIISPIDFSAIDFDVPRQ